MVIAFLHGDRRWRKCRRKLGVPYSRRALIKPWNPRRSLLSPQGLRQLFTTVGNPAEKVIDAQVTCVIAALSGCPMIPLPDDLHTTYP